MSRKIKENLLLTSPEFIQQKEFWLNKLAGDIPATTLWFEDKKNQAIQTRTEKVDIPIPSRLSLGLLKLSKQSDISLYIVLLAGLKFLLYLYTANEDITVISPLYRQKVSTDTMNNYVYIYDRLDAHITFKEFLLQTRQSVLDAYDNQDYPFPRLIRSLYDFHNQPNNRELSLIVCTLQNIHENTFFDQEEIRDKLIFSLTREQNRVKGHILYRSGMYNEFYIKQISRHFVGILENVTTNFNIKISHITCLTKQEKEQLIDAFNRTEFPYPNDQTLHQLFEKQAAQTPDSIAVIGPGPNAWGMEFDAGAVSLTDLLLTYRELNNQSNQLAHRLKDKGITPTGIVAVIVERSLEMVIGILAVLKAGGAYLPISVEYPEKRRKYLLKDSQPQLLLTRHHIAQRYRKGWLKGFTDKLVIFAGQEAGSGNSPNLDLALTSSNPVYLLYTSGTTGKPNGVLVEHRSAVNVVTWFGRNYGLKIGVKLLQLSDYTFDASVNQIFAPLLHGATLHVITENLLGDLDLLRTYIDSHGIGIINFVPIFLKALLSNAKKLASLEMVISGAEELEDETKDQILSKGYQLYNHYGPTETTIDALSLRCDLGRVTLGRPIANTRCFILDREGTLLPIGVPGELCVSGAGVARGYLNNPELTNSRFQITKNMSDKSYMSYIYRTGDLAKWLLDGTIEFLGRIDHQVKIRGHRIELGEIESRLKKHQDIKEAIAVAKEGSTGDRFLCAYYVSDREIPLAELKKHLAAELQDYLIPSFLMQIEKVPLTPGGKIDRSRLPSPVLKPGKDYIAPRNTMEKKLVEIWWKVLAVEKNIIGIENSFFQLGGHSLKAILLASEIHKAFNVKIALKQIFNFPTIKKLAKHLKELKEDHFSSIEPTEEKEYYELSSAQKRLYVLQQMEPAGTVYNMPQQFVLAGELDKKRLEKTFEKLIKRHDSLRTSVEIVNEEPVQRVHKKVEFEIEYYDMKEVEVKVKVEEEQSSVLEGTRGLAPLPTDSAATFSNRRLTSIIKNFVRPFDLSQAPLLRVGLIHLHTLPFGHLSQEGRAQKDILIVDMHHIISDGVSLQLLIKDFRAFYQKEELPFLKIQYKDFSGWQNHQTGSEAIQKQQEYWLNEFSAGVPVLNLPYDYPRPVEQSFEGDIIDFTLGKEEMLQLNLLASQEAATLYMVLLAIFYVLLAKLSGNEDIVIGCPIAGRRHPDLQQVIGMFVNTLALRNYPVGEKPFNEFLKTVKEKTLKAFENQDYQFETLVEKLPVHREPGGNPLFDVLLALQNMGEKENAVPDEYQYEYQYQHRKAKFDLMIVCIETKNNLFFQFSYRAKLYKKETIERFITYFKQIAAVVVEHPGEKISDIDIISKEKRNQLIKKIKEQKSHLIENVGKNQNLPGIPEADFDY